MDDRKLAMCEKIMKLMNLAKEENNSHAGERESAQRMAAKLMSENDIQICDLLEGKIKDGYFVQFDMVMGKEQCDWETALARAIAYAFDVRIVQRHTPWTLMYCGNSSDIDISCWFFKMIRRSIGIAAERQWKKSADRNTFCLSASFEIGDRMAALYRAKEEFATTDSRALVVVKQKGLEEFVEKQFPNLVIGKALKSNGSREAASAGRNLGKSISISRPIGSGSVAAQLG